MNSKVFSLHDSSRIRNLRGSWRDGLVNCSKNHSDNYGLRGIFRNVKPDAAQNRIGQTVTSGYHQNVLQSFELK